MRQQNQQWNSLIRLVVALAFLQLPGPSFGQAQTTVHVWEKVEISLTAKNTYDNPYTDIDVWVQLQGPGGFNKRVWGFWDGASLFRVRVVAPTPGTWVWTSGSSVDDPGLRGQSGSFTAQPWSEEEKEANPNRRGFLRPTPNGHALNYADGSPFFLLGDTWWAASTWRYPMKNKSVPADYVPTPDIGFEEAVQYNKRRGYNGIAMIAAYPNWHNDGHPVVLNDIDGTRIRSCASWKDNQTSGAKDMRDEKGNRPFFFPGKAPTLKNVCADFDRLNPLYFQSLDKKLDYCHDVGFVLFFETVRRDHIPSWKTYHDFNVSFPRYVNYLASRYGCYNIIFSAAHMDSGAHEIETAITLWNRRYGGLPFGQPVTSLAAVSTLALFGHGDDAPWLTLHGIGNSTPRVNSAILAMEPIFRLPNPLPAITQEPYYPGAHNRWNLKGRMEIPITDSPRDQYYARAHAYGGVLSGGLGGHIYGTNAWDGDVAAVEPRKEAWGQGNEYIHEALQFKVGGQMQYLRNFILSEGHRYQDLDLVPEDIIPRTSVSGPRGYTMSGLAFMMRTPDKTLAMLYFEDACKKAVLKNMKPNALYIAKWFNPRTGEWSQAGSALLGTDRSGKLQLPDFPGGLKTTRPNEDWALKLVLPD